MPKEYTENRITHETETNVNINDTIMFVWFNLNL